MSDYLRLGKVAPWYYILVVVEIKHIPLSPKRNIEVSHTLHLERRSIHVYLCGFPDLRLDDLRSRQ